MYPRSTEIFIDFPSSYPFHFEILSVSNFTLRVYGVLFSFGGEHIDIEYILVVLNVALFVSMSLQS